MPIITVSSDEHYYIMPSFTRKKKQSSLFAIDIHIDSSYDALVNPKYYSRYFTYYYGQLDT